MNTRRAIISCISVTRKGILLMSILFPWFIRRSILCCLCNAEIASGAYVGRSYIDTRKLVLGKNACIGNFNFFRGVNEISLGSDASIGNLCWVTGISHINQQHNNINTAVGRLIMNNGSAITNRHYIDVHADIVFGSKSLLAGIGSTLFTHSIDFSICRQKAKPIEIGVGSFIGTNSVLLPGTYVPDRCIVGAGAVLTGRLNHEECLYGGVPAKLIKKLSSEYLNFFDRTNACVD